MDKYITLGLLTFIAILLIILHNRKEPFASKKEKAQTIYDWFINSDSHTYNDYKKNMDNKSNIVEYEDVLRLFQNKNLTLKSVENII
jgi:hypothetical protein